MILDEMDKLNVAQYNSSVQFAEGIQDLRRCLDLLAEAFVRFPVDGENCPVCGTPLQIIPGWPSAPELEIPGMEDIIYCSSCIEPTRIGKNKIEGVVEYGEE